MLSNATSVMLVLPVLLVLGACSSRKSSMPTSPTSPLLRVTPADGATAVRLDDAVVLDFGASVNRSVVEGGVHLISEYDMNDECPDSTMAAHGTMNMVMSDSTMLRHMAQFHATHGTYSWNASGTVCTFRPDSLMRGQTRYMVHMNRGMLEMMQQMGGTMMSGGMMSGSMMSDGDMVAHFTTMNADGHSGHH